MGEWPQVAAVVSSGWMDVPVGGWVLFVDVPGGCVSLWEGGCPQCMCPWGVSKCLTSWMGVLGWVHVPGWRWMFAVGVPSGCPQRVRACVCVFVPGGCPAGFPGLCHLVVLRRVGGVGGWSARGCEVVFRNQSHVSCQCHHLTSFAVLMDISRREVGTWGTRRGAWGQRGTDVTQGTWRDTVTMGHGMTQGEGPGGHMVGGWRHMQQ